jgi:HEPN domain-containing protein
MKFTQNFLCSCGYKLPFSAYGDGDWSSIVCPICGNASGVIDPLSVSVTAERLLYRSETELEAGDYSLSILLSTIAVECFLPQMFIKLKEMKSLGEGFSLRTPENEEAWEREYGKRSGFENPADFISKEMSGKTFDLFVASNRRAMSVMSSFPEAIGLSAKSYFQRELFNRRNRIVHWGYVNSTKEEAEHCHKLAIAIVSILREMDRVKYANL